MHPTDTTPHTHDELREILARLEGVEGPAVAELRDHAEKLLDMPEERVAALSEAARLAVEAVTQTGKLPPRVRLRRCPICGRDMSDLARQARHCSRSCSEKAARAKADRFPGDVERLLRYAHEQGRLAELRRLVREWQPPTSVPGFET